MAALTSEDHILSIMDTYFPRSHASLELSRGDDCAVLAGTPPRSISCDIFAEDSHFRRRYFSPEDVGYKALAVNISDLAASGSRPEGYCLCLTLSHGEDEEWMHGFARGMAALSQKYDMTLAGGDIARSESIHVSITAWGSLPLTSPQGLRRGCAQAGDYLFAIGGLGLARVGLTVLEDSWDEVTLAEAKTRWPQSCASHLRPEPLVAEGQLLLQLASAHPHRFSLMDISDGLARDLPRLLNRMHTGLGAELYLPDHQLPEEVRRFCAQARLDAPRFAYEGGEDYGLLGSCPASAWPEVAAALPHAYCIGKIIPGAITLEGQPAHIEGFDHFSSTP